MFPPLVGFTGTVTPNSTAATSTTWANNGISWISSVSSTYTGEAGFTSEKLFDSNVNTSWHNTGSGYANGVATTVFSTSINSGGTVSTVNGDWMQIQSSVPVIMKNFTLNLRSSFPGRMPKTFYLVGSNNGSTWTTIMYGTTTSTTGTLSGLVPVSTLTSSGTGTIANFYGSTSLSYTTYGNVTTPFTYFRFITTHLTSTGETFLNISEWNINFTPTITQAITLAPSTTAYGQLDLTGGLTSLGIGTNNPQGRLHIGSNLNYGNNYLQIENTLTNSWNSVGIYNDTRYITAFGGAEHTKSFNVGPGGVGIGFAPPTYDKEGTHALYVNGKVGIGITNPAYMLQVNGAIASNNGFVGKSGTGGAFSNTFNIEWTGSAARIWIDNSLIGTIATTSDYRLKENIQPVLGVLDRLCDIPIFSYEFKTQGIHKKNGAHIGYFAHELQDKFPEFNNIVSGTKDECDNSGNMITQIINNFEFSSILAKSIQEQQVLIQSQQSQIDALVARLAAAGIA
jgi:hypothetical protein